MATPLRSSPVLIMENGLLRRPVEVGPSAGAARRRSCRVRAPIVLDDRPRSAGQSDHLAGEPRQPFHAAGVGVEQEKVLDADADLPLQVDPRLYGEHGWRRQRRVEGEPAERWQLVSREADPVPKAVLVRREAAVALDRPPGQLVEVATAR